MGQEASQTGSSTLSLSGRLSFGHCGRSIGVAHHDLGCNKCGALTAKGKVSIL